MGPRGRGPIKQRTFLLALAGFQTTFGDFGHIKVQKVDVCDYVRNEAMLVLVVLHVFSKNMICSKILAKHVFGKITCC